MATRTAPTVDGSPNKTIVTLHLIDASGDQFTDAYVVATAPENGEIEDLAAAYQAATQASVWKVSVSSEYVGDADGDNADTGSRDSIGDGINLLYKNLTTLKTQSPRLIAPIGAVMQGNQDIPLLSATEATALIAAQLVVLDGYSLASAQYTERRERSNNPRVKV